VITWTDAKTSIQYQASNATDTELAQIYKDWNTGYHLFNAQLARYYSRKQGFTNLVAGQSIYQVPYDCVRLSTIVVTVTAATPMPVTQCKSELEWRRLISYPAQSTWPTNYFALGNESYQLWPTPSQSVNNGLRVIYQPQDHDLGVDDTLSTSATLVTATNGTTTIQSAGSPFNSDMAGLFFQVKGVTDTNWYPISSATASSLTLQTPFTGNTSTNLAWRVGQTSIIPQEYDDAPMHYALGLYWAAKGNTRRSLFHLGTEDRPGMFYQMISSCLDHYSSSTTSSLSQSTDVALNPWLITPPASVS
jgi:hypothetical protein